MKLSAYFLKTTKQVSDEDTSISAKLLKQGGFIQESVSGRFYFLPIGQRIQQKIMAIIKQEMDEAGCQEIVTPILHPIELWRETNRTDSAGFELMTVKDRREAEFALGGTAEEMIVDLVRKYRLSYRDLPFHLYQFSPKFRDELRARGGLLRVREFMMKDGYSFHKNEDDFKVEYQKMRDLYTRVFEKLGLKTEVAESDNGYIGGDYCHEFIVESDIGESRYFVSDTGVCAHEDRATANQKETWIEKKGIEVGNIFQLGYHYSTLMKGATYTDQDGKEKPLYMGCYGIGIGRTMAAIVEAHHDERGIVWPSAVAPFRVHLIALKGGESVANDLYANLHRQGIEVLYDDRDKSAGEKLADADLIGIPLRLVISHRTLQSSGCEYKYRQDSQAQVIPLSDVMKLLDG